MPGENCLRVNLWTPGINHTKKRPVMVWLHGGGFSTGSGSSPLYDGASLAHTHDVVLVSINHRLNVFGFTYLAEAGGSDFALSGEVGMLDVVAALQWVRDHIDRLMHNIAAGITAGRQKTKPRGVSVVRGGRRQFHLCRAPPARQPGAWRRQVCRGAAADGR